MASKTSQCDSILVHVYIFIYTYVYTYYLYTYIYIYICRLYIYRLCIFKHIAILYFRERKKNHFLFPVWSFKSMLSQQCHENRTLRLPQPPLLPSAASVVWKPCGFELEIPSWSNWQLTKKRNLVINIGEIHMGMQNLFDITVDAFRCIVFLKRLETKWWHSTWHASGMPTEMLCATPETIFLRCCCLIWRMRILTNMLWAAKVTARSWVLWNLGWRATLAPAPCSCIFPVLASWVFYFWMRIWLGTNSKFVVQVSRFFWDMKLIQYMNLMIFKQALL